MSQLKGRQRSRATVLHFKVPRLLAEKANESFSQSLFDDHVSKNIREAAKKTKFFQEMVDGTLSPEMYGGYMVQDAAFCFESVEAFDTAAVNSQEANAIPNDFALLYRSHSSSYRGYNQDFVKEWKLKDASSVVLGPAAVMYVGYNSTLAKQDPKNLSIGILPCSMLWPWIANELINKVNPTSVYKEWFENNKGNGSPSSSQVFADKFFSIETDKEKCQPIFNEGMVNELNFFLSACNEPLVNYSTYFE